MGRILSPSIMTVGRGGGIGRPAIAADSGGGGPVDNSISFDAFSNSGAINFSHSWTHTPVGTPRGVLVLIVQTVSVTDEVTSVTYGGVAMSEVPLSPMIHTAGSEDGVCYGYFLGAGIPTGARTVAVTVTASSTMYVVVMSLTATADLVVDSTGFLDAASGLTPSATVATTADTTTFVAGVLKSGGATTAVFSPGTGYTDVAEFDFGTSGASWIRKTVNATGGNVVVAWTSTLEEPAGILAVAIK